jgi:hypothetical protein
MASRSLLPADADFKDVLVQIEAPRGYVQTKFSLAFPGTGVDGGQSVWTLTKLIHLRTHHHSKDSWTFSVFFWNVMVFVRIAARFKVGMHRRNWRVGDATVPQG